MKNIFLTSAALSMIVLTAFGSAAKTEAKSMEINKIHNGIIEHPSYHGWPTVIRTKDNKLIAVCSGNRQKHVCPFGRVWMYVSEDGGRSWQGPKTLSSGPLPP